MKRLGKKAKGYCSLQNAEAESPASVGTFECKTGGPTQRFDNPIKKGQGREGGSAKQNQGGIGDDLQPGQSTRNWGKRIPG